MPYHAQHRYSLGATDAEKQRRYGSMGLAASGVGLYYLSQKNYLVAGLYSAIAALKSRSNIRRASSPTRTTFFR